MEFDQPIPRTKRASTLARLQNQLTNVGSTIANFKKTIIVSTVLTAAFCGAMFGLVLTANEMSKDTTTHNNVLIDSKTNLPVTVMSPHNTKPLDQWSHSELKKLDHIEFEIQGGFNAYLRVTGLMYNDDDVIFITDEGRYALTENGYLSEVSIDNEINSRRSLQAIHGSENCTRRCFGSYCWWSPSGCNDSENGDDTNQQASTAAKTQPFGSGGIPEIEDNYEPNISLTSG